MRQIGLQPGQQLGPQRARLARDGGVVQQLIAQPLAARMHKKLVRARPLAHLRIVAKDVAHLLGLARV